MQKLKILLLLFTVMFAFSSCMSQETELKHRLIIEGIGIDREKDKYNLTVQVLSSAQSGGSENSGSSSSETLNYTVSGETIAQAVNSLCDTTGKNPLYSQNRIIVFGSELSGEEIISSLDYFVREYTARSDVSVAVATGKAEDIITVSNNSGEVPAKIIESSILESYNNSISVNTELYKAINLYLEEGTDFTMPLLEVVKDRNKDEETVKVTGTYIMADKDEKNMLSADETMFLQLITGNGEKGTFSVNTKDGAVGIDIISVKSKIKASRKDGKPFFDIKIKMVADVIEYNGSFTEKDIKTLTRQISSYLSSGATELLNREIKKEKSDPFRFGRMFLKEEKELYEKLTEKGGNIIDNMDYSVSSDVTIRRIGQETLKK